MEQENRTNVIIFTAVCLLLGLCALLSSCKTAEVKPENVTVTTPTPAPATLSWETKEHPERSGWTRMTMGMVEREFDSLEKAADVERFCPRYFKIPKAQKIHFWAELVSAMAKFESSWNPKAASVDVGTTAKRDTWSVGLLQMSVVDQVSYKLPLGYQYEDLLFPMPNLDLGIRILAQQIAKKGSIVLSTGVYWAVLKEGGKYQKIAQIAAMTSQLPFCAY